MSKRTFAEVMNGADTVRSRPRHRWRTALRWIVPLVALRVVWIIIFRTRPKIVMDWLRGFNNKVLNPVMLRMAGRQHFYAARLEHRGRHSGKTYATPLVAVPVAGGFAIPLPYGVDVDWCHNLLAADGALEVRGRWHPVTAPVVTPLAALRGQLPRRWQLVGAVYGIRDWLVVATEPDGVTDAPEPGAAALTAAGVAWDAWRTARRGPHAIRARQRERLAALVGHARRKSRFYAELYRDLPPDAVELAGLPPTTKSALMARFDDWVTDPEVTRSAVESFVAGPNNLGAEFLDRYLVFTTSGSTGVPALLVQDKRALAVMTGLAYGRSATAVTPGLVRRTLGRGVRLAAIFATGGHFLTTTMFEHRQRLVPARRRVARFFSVQDPLPRLVEQLNAYQPTLIASYPSVLSVLADERLAGRLRLDPIMIVSGGELLPRTVRRRISSAFGCPVSETYSASEATPLAVPCRLGRLHVNADWFILEPMDATGAPVPAGQRSHSVLVTNLANYVQPIIRYDLGDSVVMDRQPCACDNPLPTIRVEGRTDEIIEMPRADGQPVALLPMALATVVEETPGVLRFQIVHTAPSTLAVRLQADPGSGRGQVWAAVRARLSGYLADQGLPAVGLELAAELPVPVAGSGKLRHVIRADAVAVQSGDVSSPDP